MKKLSLVFMLALVLPKPLFADVILAARTLRAHSILNADDVLLSKSENDEPISDISQVVGLETRLVIYKGRPIGPTDIGPPAIVQRNQIVTLVFSSGLLTISADGRSLGRAGVGDILKVMNLGSRKIINGVVDLSGSVRVGGLTNANIEQDKQ